MRSVSSRVFAVFGLVLAVGLTAGCQGAADPTMVKAGVLSSIYGEDELLDQICGFPIDPMARPSVEVEVTEAQAKDLPMFGDKSAPGTAKVKLTGARKKGESAATPCEAKLAFQWAADAKYVRLANGKSRTSTSFYAFDFKKL